MERKNSVSLDIDENESLEKSLDTTQELAKISNGSSSKQHVTIDNDRGSFSKYMQIRHSKVEYPLQSKIKNRCCKKNNQSETNVHKNIGKIVKTITNTVNQLENSVINSSIKVNREKINLVVSCSQKEKDFVSFDTLSQQICNNDDVQQNIHVSNSAPKFESQWGCDTQLATLADNADAILNLIGCKEMTQTYDLNDSFHEPFTEKVSVSADDKKHSTNSVHNTNNIDDSLGSKNSPNSEVINPELKKNASKSDLSKSNDAILTDDINNLNKPVLEDSSIFKIPKLATKSPRARKTNSKLDSPKFIQTMIGTVSKSCDLLTKSSYTKTEQSFYPMTKTDDFFSTGSNSNDANVFVGFSTASNKKIKISENAIKNAQNLFETIDQDDLSMPVTESNFGDHEDMSVKHCKTIVVSESFQSKKNGNKLIAKHIPNSSLDKNTLPIEEKIGTKNNFSDSPTKKDDLKMTVDSSSKKEIDDNFTSSLITVVNLDEWEGFCSSLNSQSNDEEYETKIYEEVIIKQEVSDSDCDNLLNLANVSTDEDNKCCSPIIVSQISLKNSRRNSLNINTVSEYSELLSKDVLSRNDNTLLSSNIDKKIQSKQVKSARKLFIEELKNVAIHERIPSDLCEKPLEDQLSLISINNTSLGSSIFSHFEDVDSKDQSVNVVTPDNTITEEKDIVNIDNSNNLSSISLSTTLTCHFEDDVNNTNTFLDDNTLILESIKDSVKSDKYNTIAEDGSSAVFKSDKDYKHTDAGLSMNNFKGFHTASNKEIKISTKALNAAKTVFQNIDGDKDLNTDIPEDYNILTPIIGSSSEDKFNICLIEDVNILENTTNHADQSSGKELKELYTSSNKVISVTDKALPVAVGFLKDVDEHNPLVAKIFSGDIIYPMNLTPKKEKFVPTFKSNDSFEVVIMNKDVHPFNSDSIIEESFPLKRFDSFKNSDMSKPTNVSQSTDCPESSQNDPDAIDINLFGSGFTDFMSPLPNTFCGFTTASNKMIPVSDEAMNAAKKIFNENVKNVDDTNYPDDDIFGIKCSTDNLVGFNKHKAITSENRTKFFDDNTNCATLNAEKQLNYNSIVEIDGKCTKIINNTNTVNIKPSTATEKLSDVINSFENIPGSEWNEDVFQIKQLAEDTFNLQQEIVKTNRIFDAKKDVHSLDAFGENQTASKKKSFPNSLSVVASNKETKVSSNALSTVNDIINDKNIIEDECVLPINKFEGFKTASNKTIQLTVKAMNAAKKLFNNIDSEKDSIPDLIMEDDEDVLTNKQFKVIDDANNAVKNVQGIDVARYEMLSRGKDSFGGFQTASNKIIKVSAKSLNAAKNIFKDMDIEDKKEKDDIIAERDVFATSESEEFQIVNNEMKPVSNMEIHVANNIFKEDTFPGSNNENQIGFINNFKGFQTASNKSIAVSSKGIDAAKCIFKDIEDIPGNTIFKNEDKLPINSPKKEIFTNKFQGFQTASNKIIPVSSKAINAAKKIFRDVDAVGNGGNLNLENEDVFELYSSKGKKSPTANKFQGFQTASNKIIPVSSKAIIAAKSIFKDIDPIQHIEKDVNFDDDDIFGINIADKKEVSSNNNFQGFQTASNKTIPVSRKAIDAAKSKFKDIENIENENTISRGEEKFQGFQTASNKTIPVPTKAINAAKNIFKNIDPIQNIAKDVNFDDDDIFGINIADKKEVSSNNNFHGFQTASNKTIPVSRKAIDAAKMIFKDIENIENETISRGEEKFQGFQTASHKTITVSNKAINAAKKIFKDIDPIQHIEKDVNCDDDDIFGINIADKKEVSSNNNFQGFQTASNKTIPVSRKAIDAAKTIFKDIENIKNTYSRGEEKFQGFQTASNKTITVSNKAINAAKKIFKDIDPIHHIERDVNLENDDIFGINFADKKEVPGNNNFQGFQTASNKTIPVSRKAIDAAKSIFKDIPDNDDFEDEEVKTTDIETFSVPSKVINMPKSELKEINPSVLDKNKFQGFQTASNKSIAVSTKAINAAKSIFADIEDIPRNTISQDDNKYAINDHQDEGFSTVKFQGFQTANNKTIAVSSKAMEAAKTIFSDIGDAMALQTNFESGNILHTSSNKFSGFLTGNNNKIEVSKKALLAVTNIFDNIGSENRLAKESDNAIGGVFDGVSSGQEFNDKAESHIIPVTVKCRARKTKSSDFDELSVSEIKKIKTIRKSAEENGLHQFKKTVAIPSLGSLAKKSLKSYDNSEDVNSSDIFSSQDEISSVILENFDTPFIRTKDESIDTLIECKNEFLQPTLGKRKLNTKNKQMQSVSDREKPAKRQCLTPTFIGLTQEISDCAIAFLADEDATVIVDPQDNSDLKETTSETCTSPILKFKSNRKQKRVFKVPYRKIGNLEDTDVDFELMLSQKTTTQQEKISIIDEEKPNITRILNTVENLNLDVILGDLYSEKLNRGNNKILLRDLKRVELKESLSQDVLNLNPENCFDFIFDRHRIDIKLDSTVTKVSVSFLEDLFQKHSSIDKKLLPKGWILNHIKWIMWKLAKYERSFDCFNLVLTVSNVLKQLKYRYDRELFKTERPVLRKILEKDDVASRRMTLCVSRIIKIPFEQVISEAKNVASGCPFEIELTDGWYCVTATIDKILCTAIVNKKIEIGTKLLVYGAELTNCQDGKSPLEDLSLVRLKIYANGCRRVRHYEKLGAGISRVPPFYPIPAAGPAPILTLAIVKVYPPLHIEKLPSGDTVTRSDKLEQIHSAKMESEIQSRVEKLYSQVEKEISNETYKKTKRKLINPAIAVTKANASGEELATMMESAVDPQDFISSLTNSQNESLRDAMSRRSADLRDQIDTRVRTVMEDLGVASSRKVVTVHKVRAVVLKPDKSRLKKETVISMLTLWRPDEGVTQVVREGAYLDVYGATPTGIRLGELHLSANKRTVFREVPNRNYAEKVPELEKLKRKCIFIRDMNHQNFSPDFNELDSIGFVFKIVPSDCNLELKTNDPVTVISNVQTVYMADEFMNFMAVNFWGGVCKFGYEKVIEVGVFLACSNLQHRMKTSRKRIRHLYATEFSLFTQCPRKAHFVDCLKSLEDVIKAKGVSNYIGECCLSLNETFQKQNLNSVVSFRNDNSSSSSLLFSKTDTNRFFDQSKPNNKSNVSARSFNNMKENINENSLSGLDFETTFVESTLNSCNNSSINSSFKLQNNSSFSCNNSYLSFKDKDISNVSNNTSAAELRIDRLKKYGEPPKLSPLVLNVSNSLKKEFVVPKFDLSMEESKTSSVVNVSEEEDSKLKDIQAFSQDDFFDNCSNYKDKESHFKEDFVYSPPLSLE